MYINWFIWIVFFDDRICYTKKLGVTRILKKINLMLNYTYQSENRGITNYRLIKKIYMWGCSFKRIFSFKKKVYNQDYSLNDLKYRYH